MAAIWRFLSGEIPGGFTLLIVLIVMLLIILEYAYRMGQTMPKSTCRRWQLRGTVIIVCIYALAWFKAPPKVEPLRIAVISALDSQKSDWRSRALADLTARRLRNSLRQVIVNPWTGALQEYPPPSAEMLVRSNYRVYQLSFTKDSAGAQINVVRSGGTGNTFKVVNDDITTLSANIGRWILEDLHQRKEPAAPFIKDSTPQLIDAYYRGIFWLEVAQPDSSQFYFQKVFNVDSAFIPGHLGLARCAELAGKFEEALDQYMEALRIDSLSSEALLQLGEFYLRQLDWNNAEAPLKVILTKYPFEVRTYLGLARIHPDRLRDLKTDSPERLLREALRLDPAFENARIQLAGVLNEKGDPFSARKILTEGLRINPVSTPLLLKLGAMELRAGNPDGARENYRKILSLNPKNAIAIFNLGVVDYRTKTFESAVQNFKSSLELGGPADCYYYLGLIYREQSDLDQAKACFRKRWELRSGKDDTFGELAKKSAAELERVTGERIEP